jgi:pimeloyl-ACP methyl ester carboxylesterase
MLHEGFLTTDDGVRLFYARVGEGGRPLIIPNGFGVLHDFMRIENGAEEPRRRTLTHSVVAFDTRNRGRSDRVTDESKLERGIHHEVDDIEAVRRHLEAETIDLLGHSYLGLVVILYAIVHPDRVRRIVQIGSVPPDGGRSYPRMPEDERLVDEVLARIRELQANPPTSDPEELCRSIWRTLSAIYVVHRDDADKLAGWQRCDLANERAALAHVMRWIVPSVQRVALTPRDVRTVTMPVLTVHGERDRSAPHEGARDWVRLLPDARLVSVPGAGHMPWIEAPRDVFDSIERFLSR